MSRPGVTAHAGAVAALVLLASCTIAPKPPARVAAPPPATIVPPPVSLEWQDAPLSPGTWRWRSDARGSVALFGSTGGSASFVIRCDRAERRVTLSRQAAVPGAGGATTTMAITTSYGVDALPAGAVAGSQPPYLGAVLSAADQRLDRIAFSRGRIALAVTGQPRLIVPSWAEPARVIEDCRL